MIVHCKRLYFFKQHAVLWEQFVNLLYVFEFCFCLAVYFHAFIGGICRGLNLVQLGGCRAHIFFILEQNQFAQNGRLFA